jgi:hypothetical protein
VDAKEINFDAEGLSRGFETGAVDTEGLKRETRSANAGTEGA